MGYPAVKLNSSRGKRSGVFLLKTSEGIEFYLQPSVKQERSKLEPINGHYNIVQGACELGTMAIDACVLYLLCILSNSQMYHKSVRNDRKDTGQTN
jgi:hypothetical protein